MHISSVGIGSVDSVNTTTLRYYRRSSILIAKHCHRPLSPTVIAIIRLPTTKVIFFLVDLYFQQKTPSLIIIMSPLLYHLYHWPHSSRWKTDSKSVSSFKCALIAIGRRKSRHQRWSLVSEMCCTDIEPKSGETPVLWSVEHLSTDWPKEAIIVWMRSDKGSDFWFEFCLF